MIAREADNVSRNEEGKAAKEKGSNPPSSSGVSSWARLKDPRVVRVSRALGGKDRHSKVCTVRGIRDRRVRLSVPTAIQLYDLQDRIGLNQPSKVVDWLLNAAKHEIDELPPLQMPHGNLINHNLQYSALASQSAKQAEPSGSNSWISESLLRNKSKDIVLGRESSRKDKEDSTRITEEGNVAYVSPNDFFSNIRGQSPTTPAISMLNSSGQQFMRWDSSTWSLAQSRSSGMPHQQEDTHSFNVLPLGASGTQVLLYQPAIAQSYFTSNDSATAADYVPKQFNFHMLNSSSENHLSNQQGPPFHLSTATQVPPDTK